MIRILAFILCMLPFTAFGASYQAVSTGASCLADNTGFWDCKVTYSFSVDEADFGTRSTFTSISDILISDAIIGGSIYDGPDYGIGKPYGGSNSVNVPNTGSVRNNCSDNNTQWVETDLSGNVTDLCYYKGPETAGGSLFFTESSFLLEGLGGSFPYNRYVTGRWTISAVPVPPAFYMFGAVLLGLGVLRRFKSRQFS